MTRSGLPMRNRKHASLLASGAVILVALSGCEQSEQAAAPPRETTTAATGADYGLPSFVGKIWTSSTYGQPRGSIRIFLPDKTLLIDSCFETYRIVEWGVVSENTIRWREETVPVEVQYEQPGPDRLILRIAGVDEEQTYIAASAPYVCPDMPR
jgi:hypothetical protein